MNTVLIEYYLRQIEEKPNEYGHWIAEIRNLPATLMCTAGRAQFITQQPVEIRRAELVTQSASAKGDLGEASELAFMEEQAKQILIAGVPCNVARTPTGYEVRRVSDSKGRSGTMLARNCPSEALAIKIAEVSLGADPEFRSGD